MKKRYTLSEKLISYSLLTTGLLASAAVADAQVIYTDVEPDFFDGFGSDYPLDLNNDGITDFEIITAGSAETYEVSFYYIEVQPVTGNSVGVSSDLPVAEDDRFEIDNNLKWIEGKDQMMAAFLKAPGSNSIRGNWWDQNEKFLPLRFSVDGEQHYGWARLSVTLHYYPTFKIHDYAYEAKPNTPIVAGDTGCQHISTGNMEIAHNGIDDDCDGDIDEFGVGISSKENTENIISVFPNPNDGKFVLEIILKEELNSETTIEVISLLGQKIYSRKAAIIKGKLQQDIQLTEASTGLYLVKVTIYDDVYSVPVNYFPE